MQRKTKSIMTEAQKLEVMLEALNDPTTLKGILPELEEKLKDAARRNPDAFDSILFYGAARLYLSGGADAVRGEFRRRYQTKPTDKAMSLGEMVKYKQRAAIERAKEAARLTRARQVKAVADDAAPGTGYNKRPAAGLHQLPSRSPQFLIADDGERLLKKSEALGVPSWAHSVLVMHVGKDVLEKVYNDALNSPTGKSTDPVIERDLHRAALIEAGIPETVLAQLATKLGDDDFARVLAALAQHVGTLKFWGKEAAERALLMQKAAPPPEETVQHPTWGKLKKTTPKPKEEYVNDPMWGKLRKVRR